MPCVTRILHGKHINKLNHTDWNTCVSNRNHFPEVIKLLCNIKILILIRVDCAEWEIFSGCLTFCQYVEKRWLSYVGYANDSHFEIRPDTPDEGLFLRLFDFFGWHSGREKRVSYGGNIFTRNQPFLTDILIV